MAGLSSKMREQIPALIADAQRSGAIVAAWENLKSVLEKEQLAWLQQCPPENVGCNMRNRSGEGVGALQSHYHGFDIISQGWSWHKAAEAVAVEYNGGDADNEAFNDLIVDLSEGMIPPLANMSLLSISASHTNAFLRSVKAQTRSACPHLADATGKLNMDQLCLNRSGLRDAIQHGLKWTVVSHKVVDEFPQIIDLIQKAMNTRAHESQSEFEIMLGMHQNAQQAQGDVDWKEIAKNASVSNPPCKEWLNDLAKFVCEHGGAGSLLEDLNMFSRALGSMKDQKAAGSKKAMGSEFWSKLNTVKWEAGQKNPWVIIATVKANLASPPSKVVDGFCKLVEARHMAALTSNENRDLVIQSEALMTDVRALASNVGMTPAQKASMVGKLDVRCIWHIMKLGKAGEGKNFDSLAAVAQVLCRSHTLHAPMCTTLFDSLAPCDRSRHPHM